MCVCDHYKTKNILDYWLFVFQKSHWLLAIVGYCWLLVCRKNILKFLAGYILPEINSI